MSTRDRALAPRESSPAALAQPRRSPREGGPERGRLRAIALVAWLLGGLACGGHSPGRPGALEHRVPDFHADFASFLVRHTSEGGRIDYAAAAVDRADLDRYVAQLRAVSPDSDPLAFSGEESRLAYWINAYNASAIRFVLDHYPIRSVNDVRPPPLLGWLPQGAGFFYFQRTELGGRRWNLYDLENRLVRRRFSEPRIHFALNCASLGCPELPGTPFEAGSLESELARETARFLADEQNYRLDLEARVAFLSAIFDWYERDFTSWVESHHPQLPDTLLSWLVRHLPEADARALASCNGCRIEFVPYDWSLNDVR